MGEISVSACYELISGWEEYVTWLFGEICPYMNQDLLKWEKCVPLYIKADSPKKRNMFQYQSSTIFKKGRNLSQHDISSFHNGRMGWEMDVIYSIHHLVK